MPTRSFLADLESGLPLESGPRSSSAAGCADLSWSALKYTLSAAEEAARQLHLCVAWVSEESQKDYDAWNAAKKDDDLFGPLRPASHQDITTAIYAAAPAVHADFSRNQLTSLPDAQQRPESLNPPPNHGRTNLTDDAEARTSAPTCWEDFKCSPTQPQYTTVAAQAQQKVAGSSDAAVPGLTDANAKPGSDLLGPARINAPAGRPVSVDIADLSIGSILGKGSFAVVYEGQWQGQTVAIKVLDGAAAASQKAMKEYTREMDMMSHLPDHPNILKLLATCKAPNKLILVMQHCSGGSLYQLLHSPSAYLNWHQLVGICLATAQGMMHLHSHQALHRDLKSGNILLDSSGSVKVADFGLSRLQAAACGEPLTAELGTWQWMAPEVVAPWDQRGAVYTEKADVYSFGIVMWECAAREVPFKQYDGHQAAVMATYKGMRPDIPKETPEPLSQLIRECWSPAYGRRPSFAEIVPRLQRLYETLSPQQAAASPHVYP